MWQLMSKAWFGLIEIWDYPMEFIDKKNNEEKNNNNSYSFEPRQKHHTIELFQPNN